MKYYISIISFLFSFSSNGQSDHHGISLDSALIRLSTKFNIEFSYSDQLLNRKLVRLVFREDLNSTLSLLLYQEDIDFKIIGSNVALFPMRKMKASGFVLDAESGDPLIGAHLYNTESFLGIVTDQNGYFNTTVRRIDSIHQVSYLGYEKITINLNQYDNRTIHLKPDADLPPILVLGKDFEYVSKYTLQQDELQILNSKLFEQLPSLGAEPDVLQYASQLPGIHLATDGVSGLRVRGGSADQNLISIDNVPVYYPFHILGYKSIFSSSDVSQIQFDKSGFDSSHNGRLSSFFNIYTKDPNLKKVKGTFSLGTFFGHGSLDIPIVKNQSAARISFKKSFGKNWIEKISSRYIDGDGIEGSNIFDYQDFNAKLVHHSKKRNHIFKASYYLGNDNFEDNKNYYGEWDDIISDDENSGKYDYGNQIGYLQWIHYLNSQWQSSTKVYYSSYKYNSVFGNYYNYVDSVDPDMSIEWLQRLKFSSKLNDTGIKHQWLYKNEEKVFKVGTTLSSHQYLNGIISTLDEEVVDGKDPSNDPYPYQETTENNSIQSSSFAQFQYEGKTWDIRAGLVVDYFKSNDYSSFQLLPRFSISKLLNKSFFVYFDFDKLVQNQHILSLSSAGLPNEVWVPANNLAPAQHAIQFSIGLKKRAENTYFQVESYYKRLTGLIDISDQALSLNQSNLDNLSIEFWEEFVDLGESENFGVELSLQHKWNRIFGQINYTWSNALRTFDQKYFGQQLSYEYNPTHQFSLQSIYKPTNTLSFGLTWIYTTSVPITLQEGSYDLYDGNEFLEEINVAKDILDPLTLPSFHRLNVSANLSIPGEKIYHDIKISISNVYNLVNYTNYKIFNQSDASDYFATLRLYRSLPLLPTLYYRIKF